MRRVNWSVVRGERSETIAARIYRDLRRDIVTADLLRLREQGAIADTLRIGPECARVPNSLRYNPAVRRTPRPDAAFPSLYGPG